MSRWLMLVLCFPAVVLAASGLSLQVKGAITLKTGNSQQTLRAFQTLPDQGVIELADGSRMVLTVYADNSEWTLTGPARLEVKAGQIRQQTGATAQIRLLRSQQATAVNQAVGKRLTTAAFAMRSQRLNALFPAQTISGYDRIFRWNRLKGINSYRLILKNAQDEVIYQADVNDHQHELPAEVVLGTQTHYHWRIESLNSTQQWADDGCFNTMSLAQQKEVNALRPAADASLSDWAVMAGALEERGAAAEASQIWSRIENGQLN